jgi:hypothetical protein
LNGGQSKVEWTGVEARPELMQHHPNFVEFDCQRSEVEQNQDFEAKMDSKTDQDPFAPGTDDLVVL